MAMELDGLNLKISATGDEASKSLDRLATTLEKLSQATQGRKLTGVNKLATRLEEIAKASEHLTGLNSSVEKVQAFANSMQILSDMQTPRLTTLKNALSAIPAIAEVINNMPTINVSKMQEIVSVLKPLESIQKNNLSNVLTNLKKIPDVAKQLESINMDKFANSIQKVTSAIKPLASEMDKIGRGFSALPTKIQRVIHNNEKLAYSNKRSEKTFNGLLTGINGVIVKFGILFTAAKRIVSKIGDWIVESNAYVENLNLFTVQMGEYTDEALGFAEKVNEAMGIDVSQWIRNQGVFKAIAGGFGVVEERANTMSKNLVQLGYDISSFFNIAVDESMTKLQSGLAGELEPLRRLGYALDQATLQQVAYGQGVKTNIQNMTQAQKSQLRYLAIMQQSTKVMGNMAREVHTPANAMRILGQQLTQLSRALGNMILPILMKVLPYATATVRVLTELAQRLANFLGFELPTIDYSSVGNLSSGFEDVSDEIDNATTAAKKFKGTLSGIDQLNIIGSTSESGGSGSGGFNQEDFNFALPEYDFLAGLEASADDVYKKVKKIFDDAIKWIRKVKPLLITIGALFAGIWAWEKAKKLFDIIKNLDVWRALSKAVLSGGKAFDLAFGAGEGIFKSLSAGVKGFRSALSPLAKTMIGVAGFVATFALWRKEFFEIANGSKTLGESMKLLIPVTAAVGTAMYVALGPIGLVVTAVGALVGALWGIHQVQTELYERDLANMWQKQGVEIEKVGAKIKTLTTNFVKTEETYLNAIANLGSVKKNIQDISYELSLMLADISGVGNITNEKIENIKKSFADLAQATKKHIQDSNNNMKLYLIANKDMLEQQGISSQTLVDIINDGTSNSIAKIDELQKKAGDFTAKGMIDEAAKIHEEMVKLAGIEIDTISIDELKSSLEDFAKVELKLDSPEAFTKFADSLAKDISEAENKLGKAKKQMLEDAAKLNVSEKERETLIDSIEMLFSVKERDLRGAIAPVFNNIETQVSMLVNDTEGRISEEFRTGLNVFRGVGALWGSDFDKQFNAEVKSRVPEAARDFKNYMGVKFKEYGAGSNLVDEYINYSPRKVVNTVNNIQKDFNKSSVSVNTELKNPTNSNMNSTRRHINSYYDTLPPKISTEIKNPTNSNLNTTRKYVNDKFSTNPAKVSTEVLNPSKYNINQVKDYARHMFSGFTISAEIEIEKTTIPGMPSSVYKALGVKGYADGGFPASGEFFMARENGIPELVGRMGGRTAVANNAQITEGIYQAVVSAMRDSGGAGGGNITLNNTVEVDGKEVARETRKYEQRNLVKSNGIN